MNMQQNRDHFKGNPNNHNRAYNRTGNKYYQKQVGDGGSSSGDPVLNMTALIKSIDDKLKKVPLDPPHWSIFRVPSRLRKLTLDCYKLYTPQLVAMGPTHSRDSFVDNSPPHLKGRGFPFQAMEEQKLVYMQSLLNRTVEPDQSLAICAQAVAEMEREARASYADPVDRDNRNLVELILVDACFALELFIKHHSGDNKDDPVFCNAWMVLTLQRDMSLMENQIPFPVLENMFKKLRLHFRKEHLLRDVSLIDLAIRFFSSAWNLKEENYRGIMSCTHFLDLLLTCYLPRSVKPDDDETKIKPNFIIELIKKYLRFLNLSSKNSDQSSKTERRKTDWELIHTALELSAAGIEFEKSESGNIFDVQWCKGSVLKIPQFRIDDLTETLLKNLIAYEQCFRGSRHHVTSYVLFMDRLINSWQDVRFLEKKQILTHLQGNSGHVSKLFNNICREVVLNDDFYFAEVCAKIHRRYRSDWLKRVAVLKRDYFPNLWKVMAFVAAFVLLALTSLQTVYSILSYYRDK